jgi:hypothetical protein
MRVPILVELEICSSVILRFSRSSFSFSPKDGKPVSRFYGRRTKFYSVETQDHRRLVIRVVSNLVICSRFRVLPWVKIGKLPDYQITKFYGGGLAGRIPVTYVHCPSDATKPIIS